jgi:opacity protein-like surface antigen
MQTFIDGLIFTLAFILIPAAALLADPPGEDILYPERGATSTVTGNLFIQLDGGLSQSSIETSKGFHVPDEDPATVPGYLKSAHGTSSDLGLTLGYRFNSLFSFGVRFDYDARHIANNGTFKTLCTMYDDQGEVADQHMIDVADKYDMTVNYLSISAIPSLHFGDFFVYGGPTVGIPLSRTINQSNTVGADEGDCKFFYGTADATTQLTGSLDGKTNLKQRLGVKFGAGYIYPLQSNIGLVIQAGADVGATDILEKDEDLMLHNPASPNGNSAPSTLNSSAMRFNTLQAAIGLRIDL